MLMTLATQSPTISALAAASVTKKPQLGRRIGHALRGGMPARLKIRRPAEVLLTGSATYDAASLADGAGATTTVTVTGAALGDVAEVSHGVSTAGITVTANVTGTDTVTVRFQNESGGTLDLASATLIARVRKNPDVACTIYGANVPNPWANRDNTCLFRQRDDVTNANLAAGDYGFLSNIAYAAFSNYNWLVLVDEFVQYVVGQGAAVGFAISSGTGTKAQIDFATQTLTADSSTTAFTTTLDYSMLDHFNLRSKQGSTVNVVTTDYTLSESASGKIVITYVVAPTTGTDPVIRLYPKPGKQFALVLVTPATVKAATTLTNVDEEIATKDAMWAATGTGTACGNIEAVVEPVAVGG